MIVLRKNSALILSCMAVMAFSGCHRQKPVVLLPKEPPVATAPADTTAQQPAQTTGQESTAATTGQEQQQTTATNPPAQPPAKVPPKHPRHAAAATKTKPAADKPAPDKQPVQEARNVPPPKVVIQEGSSATPGTSQISTAGGQDKSSTDELLDTTDKNLRNIKRQLSSDEQSMVTQIRDYITQSRQAIKDGDMGRAHNLALKARLLSDELVKQP
jgi:outer membrane biosynthesis protein TonB